MSHSINNLLCVSCGKCIKQCPQNAIYEKEIAFMSIDDSRCIDCGSCAEICQNDAIMVLSSNVI